MPKETPIPPKGGFVNNDIWLRCTRCHDTTIIGPRIGTMMSEITIRIIVADDAPQVDIAKVARCCRCNHREWVEMLPAAKEYNITKELLVSVLDHTRMEDCLRKDDFTQARERVSLSPRYNPNKIIEPIQEPLVDSTYEDNIVPF